jgi:hypothetical protein
MSEATENNEKDTFALAKKIQAERQKRIMNPEDEFYLAGMLPFGPGETADYTPKMFRNLPEDQRPVFPLTAYDRDTVREFNQAMNTENPDVGAEIVKALRKSGLTSPWHNWRTRGGKRIDFSVEKINEIPEAVLQELHVQCMAYATGLAPVEMEALG